MFEVLEKWTGDGVVAARVSGKLLHDDYAQLVPRLEESIAQYGAIRCLIELQGIQGMELRAVWDELRFDLKHATDVARCAVVGDRSWERWATAAARPIFRKAEVRFFEASDFEVAAAWVREGSGPNASPASR